MNVSVSELAHQASLAAVGYDETIRGLENKHPPFQEAKKKVQETLLGLGQAARRNDDVMDIALLTQILEGAGQPVPNRVGELYPLVDEILLKMSEDTVFARKFCIDLALTAMRKDSRGRSCW